MNDLPLIHWGIPGMKWGVRRMNRSGNVTTSVRGKRVPLMKSVRGKPVQVNGRALSNQIRQSHFSKSLQQKYGHTSVSSLVNSVKPAAKKVATVAIQAYVGYKIGQLLGNVTYNLLVK